MGQVTPWLVAAGSAALVVALFTGPLLRRLPEPAEGAGKLHYRDLATGKFVLACGVGAFGLVAVAGLTLAQPVLPMWWVLAAPVLVLAAVDARTTWLPLRLTRLCWAAMAGAAVVSALILGDPIVLVRAAAGAAIAGLLYLALWRASNGGVGFGDVRFAPLLGAACAAVDWRTLWSGLVLGSLVGGLVGAVWLLRRRRGPFPYAPALMAGPYLACVLRWLSG